MNYPYYLLVACNCFALGSVNNGDDVFAPIDCDVNGQCPCLDHVIGNRCDRCRDGYWNIVSGTGNDFISASANYMLTWQSLSDKQLFQQRSSLDMTLLFEVSAGLKNLAYAFLQAEPELNYYFNLCTSLSCNEYCSVHTLRNNLHGVSLDQYVSASGILKCFVRSHGIGVRFNGQRC
jgi:Laminin EGF domain